MNIHVGNLSFTVTEDELRKEFMAFGQVTSVNLVKDRRSGQSKGFAFVEMSSKTEGDAAIAGLHGKTLDNRTLDVSESRPRPSNRGGGFSGRGGGRGGGGRKRGGFGGGGSGGKWGRY
jgi:cold-inducible RNA-binding protein